MELLPVYLRKELTKDPYAQGKFDVAAYADPECTKLKARYPWHHEDKPTRRNKYVTLNCYKWRVVWVADK